MAMTSGSPVVETDDISTMDSKHGSKNSVDTDVTDATDSSSDGHDDNESTADNTQALVTRRSSGAQKHRGKPKRRASVGTVSEQTVASSTPSATPTKLRKPKRSFKSVGARPGGNKTSGPPRRVKSSVQGTSSRGGDVDDEDDTELGEDIALEKLYRNVFEISMDSMSNIQAIVDESLGNGKSTGEKVEKKTSTPLRRVHSKDKETSRRASRSSVSHAADNSKVKEPSKRASRSSVPLDQPIAADNLQESDNKQKEGESAPLRRVNSKVKEPSKRASRSSVPLDQSNTADNLQESDNKQTEGGNLDVFYKNVFDISMGDIDTSAQEVDAEEGKTEEMTPKKGRTMRRSSVAGAASSSPAVAHLTKEARTSTRARIRNASIMIKQQKQEEQPKKKKRPGLARRNSFGSTRDMFKPPSDEDTCADRHFSNNDNNIIDCPATTGTMRRTRGPRAAHRQTLAARNTEIEKAMVLLGKQEKESEHKPTERPGMQRSNSFGSTRDLLKPKQNDDDTLHSSGEPRRLRGHRGSRLSSQARKQELQNAMGQIWEEEDKRVQTTEKWKELKSQFQNVSKEMSQEKSQRRERLSMLAPPEQELGGFELEKLAAAMKGVKQ